MHCEFYDLLEEYIGRCSNRDNDLTRLREDIVDLVKQSRNEELLGHIFRFFLIAGRDIDFIQDSLTEEQLRSNITEIISLHQGEYKMTRQKFEHIKRVLVKKRILDVLANLVSKIFFGQLSLYEQLEQDTEYSTEGQYRELNLPCREKLSLAIEVKQMIQDELARPQ